MAAPEMKLVGLLRDRRRCSSSPGRAFPLAAASRISRAGGRLEAPAAVYYHDFMRSEAARIEHWI